MEISVEILNLFKSNRLRLIRLSDEHKIKSFNCGNADLNDFLFNDAKDYLRHLRYTTTLLETDKKVIAYYSLANDLLYISDTGDFADEMKDSIIDFNFWEKFLNQKAYPAVKIGRLAVDKEYQDKGLGKIIIDSLVTSFTRNNKTGCQFITVDAINDNTQRTIRFYEKNGFKMLTLGDVNKNSRQMYKSLLENSIE